MVVLSRGFLLYAAKRFKLLVKKSEENFPFPPFACLWYFLPHSRFLGNSFFLSYSYHQFHLRATPESKLL